MTQQEADQALIVDGDLFFIAKLSAILAREGYVVRSARDSEHVKASLAVGPCAVALVNAGSDSVHWQEAIKLTLAAHVPTLAYAPHVEAATQAEARALGAHTIIANSRLTLDDLPKILRKTRARALRTTHDLSHEEAQEP